MNSKLSLISLYGNNFMEIHNWIFLRITKDYITFRLPQNYIEKNSQFGLKLFQIQI